MWEAIKRRAPDVEEGIVVRVGTPLTHARFLRRYRGNYGLALAAGGPMEFPKVTTPLPGLMRCGDSTTAGIGVPAVASSGAQCANALLNIFEQIDMNSKIKMCSAVSCTHRATGSIRAGAWVGWSTYRATARRHSLSAVQPPRPQSHDL